MMRMKKKFLLVMALCAALSSFADKRKTVLLLGIPSVWDMRLMSAR